MPQSGATTACVIFNPAAGRRRAARRLKRFLTAHEGKATFRPTQHAGHAVELARAAAEEGFATIAAAGGDGTAHEVANGLLQSGRDVTFAVVPIGSANDYAHSVVHQFGTAPLTDATGHLVDVGLLRAGGRERFFIEGLGLGLVARVTVEAHRIAWLQGVPLYGLAAWRALGSAPEPPRTEIKFDGGDWTARRTLSLSVLLGRREGNFLLAPHASLNDGQFEYVEAREIGRWAALALLPRLAVAGPPQSHPEIRLGRCHSVALRSPVPFTIHTDGEIFCVPDEKISECEMTLLPGRLRVKVCPI